MARDKSSGGSGAEIDELEKRYRGLAKKGKASHPLAAENLEYWLSKKGGTKSISSAHFSKDGAVLRHLKDKHRSIFLSVKDKKKGIAKRINKDKKEGKEYPMTWEDSLYATALSDLFYALGGFTLVSEVKVKVVKIRGNEADVKFTSWKCTAKDVYNWDKGKSVWVPGIGTIDDEDAIKLEKAGRAKSFKIKSTTWVVKDKDVIKDAVVKLK